MIITLKCTNCRKAELDLDATEAHEYEGWECDPCATEGYEISRHTQGDNISSLEGK